MNRYKFNSCDFKTARFRFKKKKKKKKKEMGGIKRI